MLGGARPSTGYESSQIATAISSSSAPHAIRRTPKPIAADAMTSSASGIQRAPCVGTNDPVSGKPGTPLKRDHSALREHAEVTVHDQRRCAVAVERGLQLLHSRARRAL